MILDDCSECDNEWNVPAYAAADNSDLDAGCCMCLGNECGGGGGGGQQDKYWPWAVFQSFPRWPDNTLDCDNPSQCAVDDDEIVAPGHNVDVVTAAVAAAAAGDDGVDCIGLEHEEHEEK